MKRILALLTALTAVTAFSQSPVYGIPGNGGAGGALPNGTTAATQSAGDNSTKIATTAYAQNPGPTTPSSVTTSALTVNSLLNPITAVTGSGSGSGGTVAAHTYYARCVGIDSVGQNTTPSLEVATGITTSGSTSSIAWTCPTITNGTYQIWVGQSSGGENSYFTSATAAYTQTTTAGTSGTMPLQSSQQQKCAANQLPLPCVVATFVSGPLTDNLGVTTLYSVPSGGGHYRINGYYALTVKDAVSSQVPTFRVNIYDRDTGVLPPYFNLWNGNTSNTVGANNYAGVYGGGSANIEVEGSTNITIQGASYASNTAHTMTYTLHVTLEYLGNE